MATRKKIVTPIQETIQKKTLIKCGKHFLSPEDVIGFKEAKAGLYIIKLKSEPNPDWPIWVEEKDLGPLLEYFNIKGEKGQEVSCTKTPFYCQFCGHDLKDCEC